MLQSTDPEKLSNKEDSVGDTWISLRRENKIDSLCRREWKQEGSGEKLMEEDSIGKDDASQGHLG